MSDQQTADLQTFDEAPNDTERELRELMADRLTAQQTGDTERVSEINDRISALRLGAPARPTRDSLTMQAKTEQPRPAVSHPEAGHRATPALPADAMPEGLPKGSGTRDSELAPVAVRRPLAAVVCYAVASIAVLGGLASGVVAVRGGGVSLWTFAKAMSPGVVWAVALWGIGQIAVDTRAIRARVSPGSTRTVSSVSPPRSVSRA